MDFDNVFKFKFKKSDYNRPLIELSNLDFIDLCESFIDCRLIYGDEQRETFTAHPLVKTYFEINFNNKHKILFHRRIYEYLDEISKFAGPPRIAFGLSMNIEFSLVGNGFPA